jgi:hypothetical protein
MLVGNISQADLQKVFADKMKRVQACVDARGQHFLQVHSDFTNALYYRYIWSSRKLPVSVVQILT